LRTLVIETSGPACSIALFDGEKVVASRHERVGRGHAERLIPWIADLREGGRADMILVGCGPGSFTGVRVGVAAARGLGLGWGVPVYGFSSLALTAGEIDADRFTIAIEAGHGELFVQDFAKPPLRPLSEVASLTPAETAARALPRRFGNEIEPRATSALCLPSALRTLQPVPIYGRGADARPMAA
jgi:tRNA threonylcarbamoyladenosine biosynthesis protein TsaB